MFPLDYLLAAALVAGPPDSELPAGAAAAYDGITPLVKQVAVSRELLDPKEAKHLFLRVEDFRSDLNLLRQRYHDLRDAPPACDAARFPPRVVITTMLDFNRRYREHVERAARAGPNNNGNVEDLLKEIDDLHRLWDAVRESRCEFYYVTVRRQALKRVIELIGEDAFYRGDYPPHVPVWRFARIN